MKKIIFTAIAVLTTACQQRKFTELQQRSDTTIITSTTLPHHSDTVWINASLRCDSLGKVYIAEINQLISQNTRLNMTLDSLGKLQQQIIFSPDSIRLPTLYKKTTTQTNTKTKTKPHTGPTPLLAISATLFALLIAIITRRK